MQVDNLQGLQAQLQGVSPVDHPGWASVCSAELVLAGTVRVEAYVVPEAVAASSVPAIDTYTWRSTLCQSLARVRLRDTAVHCGQLTTLSCTAAS